MLVSESKMPMVMCDALNVMRFYHTQIIPYFGIEWLCCLWRCQKVGVCALDSSVMELTGDLRITLIARGHVAGDMRGLKILRGAGLCD